MTGRPGVSILWLGEVDSLICNCILWLGEVDSLICNFSVWQQVKLSMQIPPWDTLVCCWDIKQATNKQKNLNLSFCMRHFLELIGYHILFPSLPPTLVCGYTSYFRTWIWVFVCGIFLSSLLKVLVDTKVSSPFLQLMVSINIYTKNKCNFSFVNLSVCT